VWRWWQACRSKVPDSKAALRMNLDETSVCLYQGDCKGTVFATKGLKRKRPVQKVSRAKRRCCLTHVGLVCDSVEFQPFMPQFIVGNESTFLVRDLAGLQASAPPNVTLIRQKSAWNNAALCTQLIRVLGEVLKPFLHRIQPVLILDAVPLHYHRRVLDACNASQIWPVVVPAKLTWLLQPLDTHFFYKYKVWLKRCYQDARLDSDTLQLSTARFLECLYDTINRTFGDDLKLAEAFDDDGFGHDRSTIRHFIKDMLEVDGISESLVGPPSDEQLKLCFPARAKVPLEALLRSSWPLFGPPLPTRRAILAPTGVGEAGPSTTRSGRQYRPAVAEAGAALAPTEVAVVGPSTTRSGLQYRPAAARAGRVPR
jgi:hypothetical protein